MLTIFLEVLFSHSVIYDARNRDYSASNDPVFNSVMFKGYFTAALCMYGTLFVSAQNHTNDLFYQG